MTTATDFIDYSLPDYNFGIKDIYNFPQVQQPLLVNDETPILQLKPVLFQPVVIPRVAQVFQTAIPVVAKKTIRFTVADDTETLPGANISVNGVATAQTDGNGFVILPNIAIDSIIKVSFIGYDEFISTASQIPNRVVLKKGALALKEVVVINNYKKPKSNNWLWLLAGGITALGIYKYSNTGAKVVKAKI